MNDIACPHCGGSGTLGGTAHAIHGAVVSWHTCPLCTPPDPDEHHTYISGLGTIPNPNTETRNTA